MRLTQFLSEQEKTNIDIDQIKDKKMNKKAWQGLKKGFKMFYNPTENDVTTWTELKKEEPNLTNIYKYTDWKLVIAPGKRL